MKPRFSARETALILIPALALGAFALYSQRVEKVGPRGLYVEKSEIVPATPLDVSRGYSHYLKIRLGYDGRKPHWWMKREEQNVDVPVSPRLFDWALLPVEEREQTFALGDELSVRPNGQRVALRPGFARLPDVTRESGRYIFKHYLSLDRVAPEMGQVTFESVYALRELKPLHWKHVVRHAGEKVTAPVDRNPHAVIVLLKHSTHIRDHIVVTLHVKHSPRKSNQPSTISWEDVLIVDGGGHTFGVGAVPYSLNTTSIKSDPSLTQSQIFINTMTFERARPPLTLRGKISVNQNWPIPFSHRLLP